MAFVYVSDQPNRDDNSTPKVEAITQSSKANLSSAGHSIPPPNGTSHDEQSQANHAPSKSLSLSIDTPASSSPFPSPSSSFVPPPTDHEFALSPAPRKQSEAIFPTTIVLPPPEAINEPSAFGNEGPTPRLFNSVDGTDTATFGSTSDGQAALAPTDSIKTPRLGTSPSLPSSSPTPVFSLPTSSRPAPQSPAASRRTSRAISTHSSTSASSTRHRAMRDSLQARPARLSMLSMSMLPPGQKVSIKIIDYAFAVDDERRIGLGEYVPKCNRPARMNRRLAVASGALEPGTDTDNDSDDEDDEKEIPSDSWGAFNWGRLSYSSFPSASHDGGPSQGELDANFGHDAEDDEEDEYHSADEGDGEFDIEGEEGPLYPGLYRALYAFEPEGNSEMRLVEDQLVRVLGRGGGIGWAIAVRPDGQHALVPEGYLEVVKLDGEDDED